MKVKPRKKKSRFFYFFAWNLKTLTYICFIQKENEQHFKQYLVVE